MPLPAVLEDALGLSSTIVLSALFCSALIPVLAEIKLAIAFASSSATVAPAV